MAKTRTRAPQAAPATNPEPAPAGAIEEPKARGGARAGAGRKPTTGEAMDKGIYIRCSETQKDALQGFIDGVNEERKAKGLPEVDLSTWIRELALKHSGNEHLGLAARARAQAEAASSIV